MLIRRVSRAATGVIVGAKYRYLLAVMLRMQRHSQRGQHKLKQLKKQLKQLGQVWLKQLPHRATGLGHRRQRFLQNGSFHQAIAPVLVIAQCFSLMPVSGICDERAQGLGFNWRNWRTWYSLVCITSIAINGVFTINLAAHGMLDATNVEPIVFHLENLLGFCCFLQLATKWPGLMRQWRQVEDELSIFHPHANPPRHPLSHYKCQRDRENLSRRVHHLSLALFSLSLMEHLLSIISAVYDVWCPVREDPIESYLFESGAQLFFIFPYSNWLGWLAKILNVFLTFGWNYIDIFLMLIGIGLAHLFEKFSSHLRLVVHEPMPVEFWTLTRTRYRSIVELIIDMDDVISGLVLVSFASNLYFICLQLLKSINTMASTVHAVYFYFSLSFLISRATAVLLLVSSVNDRSRDPLKLLRLVPNSGYNDEVSRLFDELSTEIVALSGFKLFNVTRKLFLTIVGSIITFELVLIQFHEDEQEIWDCQQGCAHGKGQSRWLQKCLEIANKI